MKTKKNNKIFNNSNFKKTRRLKTDLSIHQTGGASSCVDDGWLDRNRSVNRKKIFDYFINKNNSENLTSETLFNFCINANVGAKGKTIDANTIDKEKKKTMILKIREILLEMLQTSTQLTYNKFNKQQQDKYNKQQQDKHSKQQQQQHDETTEIAQNEQQQQENKTTENNQNSLKIAIVKITSILKNEFKHDKIYDLYEGFYVKYQDGKVRVSIGQDIIDKYLNVQKFAEPKPNYETEYTQLKNFRDIVKEFVAIFYTIKTKGVNDKIMSQFETLKQHFLKLPDTDIHQGEKNWLDKLIAKVDNLLKNSSSSPATLSKPQQPVRIESEREGYVSSSTIGSSSSNDATTEFHEANATFPTDAPGGNIIQINIHGTPVTLNIGDCITFYKKINGQKQQITAKILKFGYTPNSINRIFYLPWNNKDNKWDEENSRGEIALSVSHSDPNNMNNWESIMKLRSCPDEPQLQEPRLQARQAALSQRLSGIREPVPPKSVLTEISPVNRQLLKPAISQIHTRIGPPGNPPEDPVFKDITSDLEKITQQLSLNPNDPNLKYRKSLLEIIAYELKYLYLYFHDSIFKQYELEIRTQIRTWKNIYSSSK